MKETTQNPNIRQTSIGHFVQYPVQRIHIELTNACNFDCVFCPKSVMTRKLGFMKKELAEKIIDEVREQELAEKITFHIMGEPMLHPDFFEILMYSKQQGLKAGITTNGSFLTEENVDKLVKADVHQINISLQTPDEKSFELRKANSLGFEKYAGRIAGYIEKLHKNNCSTIVKIHFLNTKFGGSMREKLKGTESISNTPTLRKVLSEWVTKIYSIPGLDDEIQKMKVLNSIHGVTINRWNVLEIAPNIFFETYVLDSWGNAFADDNLIGANFGYCSGLRDHFGILHDGQLIFCCKDYNGETAMGNVKEKSIVELLNSGIAINVLKGFNKYKVTHSYCKRCLGGKTRSAAILKQLGSIVFMKTMKWYFYNNRKLY